MLLADGIKTGTHKGTSILFGKSYVLNGKFSRQDGILYSQLQTMREKADYQNVFTLEETFGRNMIESAKDLQSRISDYIKSKLPSDTI